MIRRTSKRLVTIDDAHSSVNTDSLRHVTLSSGRAAQSNEGRVMMLAPLFDLQYTSQPSIALSCLQGSITLPQVTLILTK